jgi:hypothetical protein
MPWVAPAVGYVDRRGNLRCVACSDEETQDYPVWGDQHFGEDDKCCKCEKQMEHIPTSGYVNVSW